ncbi:MAG: hypothetical protein IPJ03_07300 [Ignavibacteriales bacterium]|nr:hypothetical protein [Ignavibacteriales bacterium]
MLLFLELELYHKLVHFLNNILSDLPPVPRWIGVEGKDEESSRKQQETL